MAKQPNYTEDEMALLSDEEREGMLDPDLIDDPVDEGDDGDAAAAADAEAAAAAAAEAKRIADEEAARIAAEEAAKAAAAGTGEPAKAVVVAPEKGQPVVTAPQTSQPPTWQAPENAQARLDEIENKKDELIQRFDDGELTAKEMREAMKPLEKDQQAIRDDVFKASFSQDWAKTNYFQSTVPAFLDAHKEYASNPPMFDALDAEVKRLQASAQSSGKSPFDPSILEQAHKTVRDGALKALGIDPATVKEPGKTEVKPTAQKRDLPPSLANVPAADLSETGTISKFAHLDKLEGEKYEEAIEKLSDADRDLYLSGG